MTGISTSIGIVTTIGTITTKAAAIGAADFGSRFNLSLSARLLAGTGGHHYWAAHEIAPRHKNAQTTTEDLPGEQPSRAHAADWPAIKHGVWRGFGLACLVAGRHTGTQRLRDIRGSI